MTDWKEVRGDVRPELIDKTSSSSTVYERRNIRTETIEEHGISVTQYVYDERTYTREEYENMTSPATQSIMQAISELELSVAMLG